MRPDSDILASRYSLLCLWIVGRCGRGEAGANGPGYSDPADGGRTEPVAGVADPGPVDGAKRGVGSIPTYSILATRSSLLFSWIDVAPRAEKAGANGPGYSEPGNNGRRNL